MIRVGLTGGIASGKSTVAGLFAAHGAIVIDADQLARAVVAPGTSGLADIVARFGPGVLDADGALDRAALGAIVFGDEAALADLNAITHPRVAALRDAIEREITDPYAIVIHMIPLLVETGQADRYDAIVVVDVDERTQLERLMARNGLSAASAQARIDAQASRESRLSAATWVIRNDSTVERLGDRVHAVWHELVKLRSSSPVEGCGC